jgi:hypothetical protein
MATRSFEVVDLIEILMHWHAGRPKAEVARSLGVDRKTVRKYVGAAEAVGRSREGRRCPGRSGGQGPAVVPGAVRRRAAPPDLS